MGEIDLIKEEINDISSRLTEYQRQYYQFSKSLISDKEYDALLDRLIALERRYPQFALSSSPTTRVGSDLSSTFDEVTHTTRMLSLDKVYTGEGIKEWMRKSNEKSKNNLSFTIEEKIDGVSLVLYYQDGVLDKAVTRGNGYVGNDVTANAKTIRAIPLTLPTPLTIAVRGEVFIEKEDFNRLNSTLETPFANPRNLASGTLRRLKSSETAKMPLKIYLYDAYLSSMIPTQGEMLQYLITLGFPVNPNLAIVCDSFDSIIVPDFTSIITFSHLDEYLETSYQKRASLEHEIDGLVIKVNELAMREDLGYTNHHPKWAIAYKFDSPGGETIVTSIDIQVGRTGRITPVARVVPVLVAGSTISNITLHNQDYINLLELALGDTVAISKRGDVIPAIEKVVEKNSVGNSTYLLPHKCNACDSELVSRGAHLFCPNYYCPEQVVGRISFFVGRDQMDIESFGPETVATLHRLGHLKDIPDIYTLDYSLLIGQEGFGEKKVAALIKGVDKSKEQPYKTVLLSLGLPDMGKKGVELIIKSGCTSIDMLLDYVEKDNKEPLLNVKGLGEKTVNALFESLREEHMKQIIEKLKLSGLNFEVES
ncbi:MAG: DNA ligase (NAD(+)) LigA, partial [Spirochaetia bacterium]|nr:DNA ligase (NAD(+)) LigA [Spirochaetia bacterium]